MTDRDWQTGWRLQAATLYYTKGWQQKLIAEALGVTKGAVSQWIKKVKDVPEQQWPTALQVRASTGRPPKLTPEQQRQIVALLDQGAEAFGFTGDVWTLLRLQKVAKRELGIEAGETTIRKALIEHGFSAQKPQVEASQKNPAQISGFRGGWHALKKGQKSERPASSS